jgi:N-acetyl-1-D-myo-inositol-2-amino-2-deoxy-alpha-D-glucopyranoside deacetylase
MGPSTKSGRSIAFVHAHPDDESLATGGTIARYASEGAHVCLITCTNGEEGEIAEVPGLGPPEDLKPRLGEIRRKELEEACRLLGAVDLRMLGYHDSGMAGTPENDAPVAFVNQNMDEVVAKVVDVLRDVQAQVVVTYNAFGAYGHPDHIRAHEAAMRAAEIVGIPKVYFIAFPKSLMRMARDLAEQFGIDREAFFSEEDIEKIGDDDEDVTSKIDCNAFLVQKFAALEAHRTQLGTTQLYLLIPEEFRGALGTEYYVLARTTLPRPTDTESDLFEGL